MRSAPRRADRGARRADVRILPNRAALVRDAARLITRHIRQAVDARGRCLIALSGGATPLPLFTRLARPPFRRAIPWPYLEVFWTDERFVPTTDRASNFRLARQALLSRVPIPPEQMHPVPIECGTPQEAAAAYERVIRRVSKTPAWTIPAFDLILLGLGEDGHTASLFPRAAALRTRRRLVVAAIGGAPRLPRVTFTLPLLNRARQILWLISGAKKASVVRDVLVGPRRPHLLPAQSIRPVHGASCWLLDHAAAAALPSRFHRTRQDAAGMLY